MKKIARYFSLLSLLLLLSGSLAACGFFEALPQNTAQNSPAAPPAVQEPAAVNPDAVSDEAWNALAGHFSALEKHYARTKSAYENSLVADNPDITALLERAEEIIRAMGDTKRSEMTEKDAAELEDVILTLDESMTDLYHSLTGEEEEEP